MRLKSYDPFLTVAIGDKIDFVVGRGTNGTYFNDSTALSATFTFVPEPASLIIWGLIGACGFFAVRRRRKA